jgi:molybdopterin-guanine dinucleotide biosynthesis protein A
VTHRASPAGEIITGLILAGGRSERMGGTTKAFVPLAGKPLLSHVIDRVGPQVHRLLLSVERVAGEYQGFGLPQVSDAKEGGGPLGGLLAGLQAMDKGSDWLLLVPCDAPFVPDTLAERLLDCAIESNMPGAVICYEGEIQPTFSIWRRQITARIEHAVDIQRMAGFKQFLRVQELAELDWPVTSPSPFFNINDHAALLTAGSLIETRNGKP